MNADYIQGKFPATLLKTKKKIQHLSIDTWREKDIELSKPFLCLLYQRMVCRKKPQPVISKTATMLIHINMLKIAHRQAQRNACQVPWLLPVLQPQAPARQWQETLMSDPAKPEVNGSLATWGATKAPGDRAVSYLSQHKVHLETLD